MSFISLAWISNPYNRDKYLSLSDCSFSLSFSCFSNFVLQMMFKTKALWIQAFSWRFWSQATLVAKLKIKATFSNFTPIKTNHQNRSGIASLSLLYHQLSSPLYFGAHKSRASCLLLNQIDSRFKFAFREQIVGWDKEGRGGERGRKAPEEGWQRKARKLMSESGCWSCIFRIKSQINDLRRFISSKTSPLSHF